MLTNFYKAKRESDGAPIYGYTLVSFEFGTFLLPTDDVISWRDIKNMLDGSFNEYNIDKTSVKECTYKGDKHGLFLYVGDTIKIEGKEGLFKIGTNRNNGRLDFVAIDEQCVNKYPLNDFKIDELELIDEDGKEERNNP
jgi:hypothetical protein